MIIARGAHQYTRSICLPSRDAVTISLLPARSLTHLQIRTPCRVHAFHFHGHFDVDRTFKPRLSFQEDRTQLPLSPEQLPPSLSNITPTLAPEFPVRRWRQNKTPTARPLPADPAVRISSPHRGLQNQADPSLHRCQATKSLPHSFLRHRHCHSGPNLRHVANSLLWLPCLLFDLRGLGGRVWRRSKWPWWKWLGDRRGSRRSCGVGSC